MRESFDTQTGEKVNIYGDTHLMICVQNHEVISVISISSSNRKDKDFEEVFKDALGFLLKNNFKEFSSLTKDIVMDLQCITIVESIIEEKIQQLQKNITDITDKLKAYA